jgi:hypothetical protein
MIDPLLIILGTICGAGAVWASRIGIDKLHRQRHENDKFKIPMVSGRISAPNVTRSLSIRRAPTTRENRPRARAS